MEREVTVVLPRKQGLKLRCATGPQEKVTRHSGTSKKTRIETSEQHRLSGLGLSHSGTSKKTRIETCSTRHPLHPAAQSQWYFQENKDWNSSWRMIPSLPRRVTVVLPRKQGLKPHIPREAFVILVKSQWYFQENKDWNSRSDKSLNFANSVTVVLPRKQGLKLTVFVANLAGNPVTVVLPRKQGLKHAGRHRRVEFYMRHSGTSKKTRIETLLDVLYILGICILSQWYFQENKDWNL